MKTTLIFYLAKSLVCSGLFLLVYRCLLSSTTHFKWMRLYLLASLVLSIILPLVPLMSFDLPAWLLSPSVNKAGTSLTETTFSWMMFMPDMTTNGPLVANKAWTDFAILLLAAYAVGLLLSAFFFIRRLASIRSLIAGNEKVWQEGYWLVRLRQDLPPFSFFNYLCIGPSCQKLSRDELEQVKRHELAHIHQKHSLDLLLLEVTGVVCWFNFFIPYLRKKLREVHEYLADESVSKQPSIQTSYARLLLRLASEQPPISLSTAFSGKQISRRIHMLSKSRSKAGKKYAFALILPLSASLLLLFSCLEESPESFAEKDSIKEGGKAELNEPDDSSLRIGKISWEGNTVYTDAELEQFLGLKLGDPFTSEKIFSTVHF